MCPNHSLVTSCIFKIQNVSSCGLQMSLSYPSPRADEPKCQIHPLQVSMSHWTPWLCSWGSFESIAKCHPSQFRCPNQPLWEATLMGTALLCQRNVREGRERPKGKDFPQGNGASERAGAAQVCLFAGRDLEVPGAPVTLTRCQYRAFGDENPSLQEQQGGVVNFHRERITHCPQKWGFLRGTDHVPCKHRGKDQESPKPAQFWFSPNLQVGGSLFTRCWVGVIGDFRFSHTGICWALLPFMKPSLCCASPAS